MKQCMIFATLILIFLNSGDDSLRGHDKIVKRKFILDVWKFLFSNGVINRWNSFSIQCANVILLVKKIYVTDRWARTWSRCTGSQLADDYITHSPGGRLSSFFARPAVTFPAAEHHRPLAGTKLCCLVTEAHRCDQLAHGCYLLRRFWPESNAPRRHLILLVH